MNPPPAPVVGSVAIVVGLLAAAANWGVARLLLAPSTGTTRRSGSLIFTISATSTFSQQSIPATGRDIDLMEAARLRATRTAITTTEAFEMQNKHARILEISGELVLRPWGRAHMP